MIFSSFMKKLIKQDAEKHESYRHSMQMLVYLEFKHFTGNFPSVAANILMIEQIDLIIPEDL